MPTPSDNLGHVVHEVFLLVIIGFIAFALIAAANGAYTADACAVRDHANNIEPGHETPIPVPQHRPDRPGTAVDQGAGTDRRG